MPKLAPIKQMILLQFKLCLIIEISYRIVFLLLRSQNILAIEKKIKTNKNDSFWNNEEIEIRNYVSEHKVFRKSEWNNTKNLENLIWTVQIHQESIVDFAII